MVSVKKKKNKMSGSILVGRLDRLRGPKCGFGGIAIFAGFFLTNIAPLEYEVGAERMFLFFFFYRMGTAHTRD